MTKKIEYLPSPPNYRPSQSCGTCKHWEWDYEGEGDCKLFPDLEWDYEKACHVKEAKHVCSSTMLCDKWEKED